MSTFEATVSMLETMPEDARVLVYNFTRELFTAPKPANPFTPMTTEQILSDLELSRQQIADGKGIKAKEALAEMGRQHGFI